MIEISKEIKWVGSECCNESTEKGICWRSGRKTSSEDSDCNGGTDICKVPLENVEIVDYGGFAGKTLNNFVPLLYSCFLTKENFNKE